MSKAGRRPGEVEAQGGDALAHRAASGGVYSDETFRQQGERCSRCRRRERLPAWDWGVAIAPRGDWISTGRAVGLCSATCLPPASPQRTQLICP